MPQMSPMNWNLLLFTNIFYFTMFILMFYFKNFKMNTKKMKLNKYFNYKKLIILW